MKQTIIEMIEVSTHSHPKVAAIKFTRPRHAHARFNTQPPEGGCL